MRDAENNRNRSNYCWATTVIITLKSVLLATVATSVLGCMPTSDVIATKWSDSHKDLTNLRVHATQTATEVLVEMSSTEEMLDVETIRHHPKALLVSIEVDAVMTRDGYEVEIRRAGTTATDPADITWSFHGGNETPVFTESRHDMKTGKWILASTTTAPESKVKRMRLDKSGCGDSLLEWDLFSPIYDCATANFLQIWMLNHESMSQDLSSTPCVGIQKYQEQSCYVLQDTSYDQTTTDSKGEVHHNKRADVFFVNTETFQIVGQQTLRVDAHPQKLKAWCWISESIYSYPLGSK